MMHWFSSLARIAALLALISEPTVTAQEVCSEIAPTADSTVESCPPRDDEVWLVSTRHLCFPCWDDPSTYALDVRRYDREHGWRECSTDEFVAQPPLPTVIYVHGNRVEWCEASQQGWRVYHSLASCCNGPPRMRFVIWTWSSDQVRGQLRDIRLKADRADNETYFLGWFLSQLKPTTPVSLMGFSYGSRIIAGGLHLLAGGSLSGISLPRPAEPGRVPTRVVLLAAALDHDWLCPGNLYGAALDQIDHLLILYNSCDPALQHYDRVDPCTCAAALGYVGLCCDRLGAIVERVDQMDAASYVGRTHEEDYYYCSADLKREICRALFHPLPTPNAGG